MAVPAALARFALPGDSSDAPFAERFRAWWHGVELGTSSPGDVPVPDGDGAEGDEDFDAAERIPVNWNRNRLEAAQMIWGDGFLDPGGAEYALELAEPLAMTAEKTLVDLSAGLGGMGRAIVDEYGTWVEGMEQDAFVAEEGMALSEKAGLGKRAPVRAYETIRLDFGPKRYEAVMARELLFSLPNKAKFLRTIAAALKMKGQLLLTDYVLARPGPIDPVINKWAAREPRRPFMMDVRPYVQALAESGLDIRMCEDITRPYVGRIMEGWKSLADSNRLEGLDKPFLVAVALEAEKWARRARVLRTGKMRVCRILAVEQKSASISAYVPKPSSA